MTPSNDPVKAMIAQAVRHHLATDPDDKPPLPKNPGYVESVVAALPGNPLQTNLVVTLDDGTTRTFAVRVSEL
jgi:hypothetical protein